MWLNGTGQNRKTDEKYDEDCVEEGWLQLARVKFDRDVEGGNN